MTNFNTSVVTYYPGYAQLQVHNNLLYRTIASVSNSNPMVITTTFNHFYPAGMMVRFMIPPMFGMQQLNALQGQIISTTSNTLTINIDSIGFGTFAYPNSLPGAFTNPIVIPNSSGPYLSPPPPLPYGNEDSFKGVLYNNGTFGDPVDGGIP